MAKMKASIKKNLQDELEYCKKLVERGHKNPHWQIRVDEITKQLTKKKKSK